MGDTARKYPRVRGEESLCAVCNATTAEIPPRARGRDHHAPSRYQKAGNTPACAGKSSNTSSADISKWKYPRVRGEESGGSTRGDRPAEIPPRARGRALMALLVLRFVGNTPACAGKSEWWSVRSPLPRKYPRVRGEEEIPSVMPGPYPEIPPRARGRVKGRAVECRRHGNTPACAGKSRRADRMYA